ncbi:MAG: IS200/IS605 family transposase [Candidatus Thorarchaeota archaeon]
MNSVSFVSGNRSVGLNQFHLEWCPKYRKKAFKHMSTVQLTQDSLLRTARLHKIIIHSLHIGVDHIHLFVSLPFNMSVSKAFQLFKGRAAKELFEAFPSFRKIFRKGHLWSPGKFCRSISNVKADTIRNYIEKHDFKELNRSIKDAISEAEQTRLTSFF